MSLRLTLFFIALSTLAGVHTVATKFHLYWYHNWLDIPMHILGGVCVVLGVSILPFFRLTVPHRYNISVTYLLCVLMVGICWEVFEYYAGVSLSTDPDFFVDTVIDIGMDLIGGVLGYLFIKRITKLEI